MATPPTARRYGWILPSAMARHVPPSWKAAALVGMDFPWMSSQACWLMCWLSKAYGDATGPSDAHRDSVVRPRKEISSV